MHRWPSEYRDPDGCVLDAPHDLGGHLEPGGSSHLVRVAVDRGGHAAGIATVGHVTRVRQRLGAMIPAPCHAQRGWPACPNAAMRTTRLRTSVPDPPASIRDASPDRLAALPCGSPRRTRARADPGAG